jgi:hypothetical protein
VRADRSVLDPQRVAALVARLDEGERAQAIEGLALLARAAQEQMHTGEADPADGRRHKAAEA